METLLTYHLGNVDGAAAHFRHAGSRLRERLLVAVAEAALETAEKAKQLAPGISRYRIREGIITGPVKTDDKWSIAARAFISPSRGDWFMGRFFETGIDKDGYYTKQHYRRLPGQAKTKDFVWTRVSTGKEMWRLHRWTRKSGPMKVNVGWYAKRTTRSFMRRTSDVFVKAYKTKKKLKQKAFIAPALVGLRERIQSRISAAFRLAMTEGE